MRDYGEQGTEAPRGIDHGRPHAPPGVELIPIDPKSGKRAAWGDPNVILEAFKPGEAPSDETIVIGGFSGGSGGTVPAGDAAVIEGGLTTGTGGLY